jgi:hypothetical protein
MNRLQVGSINALGIEVSVGLILLILWILWRMR